MSTCGTDLVFLGPSLSRTEAATIAPGAVLLPPAVIGDVVSALERYHPHAIALIDGNFMHTMAVFHKELVDALDRGVWVIGASSMGALRGAECAPYGMITVGEIAAGFLSGELEGDDEVALVHADAEHDFRPLSDAMVDIRATIRAAAAAGLLTDDEAGELIDRQKRRWFAERTLAASVVDARDQFAVGVTLYELLCDGKHPYPASRPMGGVEPIDPRKVRADLDPALASFLLTACAPERDDRFATAAAMKAELEDIRASL